MKISKFALVATCIFAMSGCSTDDAAKSSSVQGSTVGIQSGYGISSIAITSEEVHSSAISSDEVSIANSDAPSSGASTAENTAISLTIDGVSYDIPSEVSAWTSRGWQIDNENSVLDGRLQESGHNLKCDFGSIICTITNVGTELVDIADCLVSSVQFRYDSLNKYADSHDISINGVTLHKTTLEEANAILGEPQTVSSNSLSEVVAVYADSTISLTFEKESNLVKIIRVTGVLS